MRITRTTRTLVAAVALTLLVGACNNGGDGGGGGGSDTGSDTGTQTVSAETFVDAVCGELTTWITALQDKGETMQQQAAGASPAKARDLLTGYLDDAISATQEASAAIGEAGAPDVENGEQTSQAIIGVLDQVEQIFTGAREKVSQLPDDPAQFQAGAAEIGADISSAFAENPLAGVQEDAALSEAFANSEACSEMSSMSSATAP